MVSTPSRQTRIASPASTARRQRTCVIATDPSKPGVIQTRYGLLDPNPSPDEHILGRNYGRGPAQTRVNIRVAKAIGFGGETGRSAEQGPAASAGGATAAQASGRGLGGIIGSPKTVRRYNLII